MVYKKPSLEIQTLDAKFSEIAGKLGMTRATLMRLATIEYIKQKGYSI